MHLNDLNVLTKAIMEKFLDSGLTVGIAANREETTHQCKIAIAIESKRNFTEARQLVKEAFTETLGRAPRADEYELQQIREGSAERQPAHKGGRHR